MTLKPGARLGPYEIVAPIGAGGMGEVYRAHDTRIDRTVAIKVLPSVASASPEAAARFEREARAIARFSHPHICQLHDVGVEDGTAFLVMELIDGETLAVRLAKGALPFEDVRRYGIAIADALDAAHRTGIVHRDLKPGNIMLPRSGLKLLDFGLAKGRDVTADATLTPTLAPITSRGAVAGTVAYMAPEVLEGQPADERSDVYSLGSVLYEMATGRRYYNDPSQTVAPEMLERIVRGCLARDPEERWQSARDVRLQLAAATPSVVSAASEPKHATWLPWAVAIVALSVAAAAVWRLANTRTEMPGATLRFGVLPPAGTTFWDNLESDPMAIAPDGSKIGFIATDGRVQQVWLQAIGSLSATAVPGTEGARSLFWSPDARSIGFFAAGKLKRIDLPAGAPVTICDVVENLGLDGTWGAGDILYSSIIGDAIYRVAASGGTPVIERQPDPNRGERRVAYPSFLSDGRRFVYSVRDQSDSGRVVLAEPNGTARDLVPFVTNAQFVEPDYLVYAHEGTLVAQRFDASRATMIGAPHAIADSVRFFYSTGVARFSVSRNGTAIYHAPVDAERVALIDRSGRDESTLASGAFITLRVSPDGSRVAFSRAQPKIGTFDLWVTDFARGTEQRITSDPKSEVNPVWHPDGLTLFYGGGPGTPHLMRHSFADGHDTDLQPPQDQPQKVQFQQYPEDMTSDGRTLIFVERGPNADIWIADPDRLSERTPLVKTPFVDYQPRLAPDGRHFAFVSNESGRNEVYVSTFPPRGLKMPASSGGGTVPRWSPDGRELFYLSADRRLMAVPVRASPGFALGDPSPLFALPGRRVWKDYDVARDRQRFVAIVTDRLGDEQAMTVVTNWTAELSR